MKRTCEVIKNLRYQLCLAVIGLCLSGQALAQEGKDKDKDAAKDKDKDKPAAGAPDKPAAGAPARREESVRASVTGKVTAVDPEKRQVTLKGPEKEITVTVDKDVKRFDEIKVGDSVTADYYVSLAAELREPTAEEKAKPLSEMEVEAKSEPGTDPAAAAARRVKAVTTVESLDPAKKTVTIKGPRGKTREIAVKDPAVFQKLKQGDFIVITFTEALAVSLDKKE